MYGRENAFVLLRPRDRQHVRETLPDRLGLGAHAAGHDDASVLRHRLADGAERLGLGGIEEPAGIDDHDVGAVVALGQLVALRSQPGDDSRPNRRAPWGTRANTNEIFGARSDAAAWLIL